MWKSIIYVVLQNSSEVIQLRFLHCCILLNLTISKQKIWLLIHDTLECYQRLHKVVSCMYKIWLWGLTCNLQFWMPTVNSNKTLAGRAWLTNLKDYVQYVMLINTYFILLYTYLSIIYVICLTINYEKFAHSCYQMNTKINHKLFQLWT